LSNGCTAGSGHAGWVKGNPKRDVLELATLPTAGDELADVLMSRYEKLSTLVTSNRPIDDWPTLRGDAVVVAPLLDRLMHHGGAGTGCQTRRDRVKLVRPIASAGGI
jgi:hypothetical protein